MVKEVVKILAHNQYCRLTALIEDVGPMIRQWTLGSAITHLRSFVSGVTVEQGTSRGGW